MTKSKGRREKNNSGGSHNGRRKKATRSVAPLVYAHAVNEAIVLQFRLARALELPRLPEEFKFTSSPEERAEKKGKDGYVLRKAEQYSMPKMKSLLSHLRDMYFFFTGFSYVEETDERNRVFHKYRFVFTRSNERGDLFQKHAGGLYVILENLMRRPPFTSGGGVIVYCNPVVDECGEPVKGKNWLSVNIAEGVFPQQKPQPMKGKIAGNGRDQKDRSAAWEKKFSPHSPKITKGEKKAEKALAKTTKPVTTGRDWHDTLADLGKKWGVEK
ncbi:MAG: hypothetical protein H8D63_02410 [Parcubacteria group bacterium]|nr:hypothetical protein [Parcubacteria group bacterium]